MTTAAHTPHAARLAALQTAVQPFSAEFPELITDFAALKADFATKVERFSHAEQTLSIGIIGQVKAGKSTFLNALLFDGKPVLPAAATPKTANLTRIRYGEQYRLEVSYYQPEEWAEIEATAAETGDHAEAKVARELLAMATASGVNIAATLAQGQTQHDAADERGLMGLLNDYAGEDGRYTALVKSTDLYLPRAEIRGFEVVDTPGMNDPVMSRTQKTKDYMAGCDVVFFLSRRSQFLDQSDMDLLARQLPSKGVKRMVLVACQMDATLQDEGHNADSLAAFEQGMAQQLAKRTQREMSTFAEQREKAGHAEAAALLRGVRAVPSSTFAHGYAHWPEAAWSDAMRHTHSELTELATDCWAGYTFTQADWHRLGNFDALTEAYQTARTDKTAILAAQRAGMVSEAERTLGEQLTVSSKKVEERAREVKTGDVKQLNSQKAACQQYLDKLAATLSTVLDSTLAEVQRTHQTVLGEMKAAQQSFTRLDTRTGTETETEYYTVSTSNWYNPFSWGDTETRSYTTSRSYSYLATSDAVAKIVSYEEDCIAQLTTQFAALISPETLRINLGRALVGVLNSNSPDFDPAAFRSTLEGTVRRLEIPRLQIALSDTANLISHHFRGEVRSSSDMDALRDMQRKALGTVFTRLAQTFDAEVQRLCAQLTVLQASLGEQFSAQVHAEMAQVEAAFADREAALARYEKLLSLLRTA